MSSTPDPSATFHLDQQEAEAQEATRDQTIWEQNVANAKANTAHTIAMANLLQAKANALGVLTSQATLALTFLGLRSILRRKK